MGKLFGIGIGPGDPGLITVKAQQILAGVDVLFVPQSKHDKSSVALEIVNQYIKPTTEIIKILLPMIKDPQVLQESWSTGAKQIVAALAQHKSGAFITLGDCMLYSTYTYLLNEVKKIEPSLSVENVPGITSFAAAAAILSVPLAERDENLAVIPALNKVEDLAKILALHENVVFLKVASQIDRLTAILIEFGLEKNVVFVSKCGHDDQEIIYDLKELMDKKLEYLSLMIVKKGGLS